MKGFLRIISLIVVLLTCISAVACGQEGDDTTMNNDTPIIDARTKVGDKVILGKYEQDGNMAEKEPISWTVIKTEDGRALLLADYCISYGGFHDVSEAFTWADSDIRDRLNKDFYLTAFDDAEKALIEEVTLDNGENYIFALGEGDSTKDKVFLLSLEEANELLDESTIKGVPTEQVKKTASLTHGSKSCNWWLRTQGSTDKKAVVVGYNEVINYPGLRGDIAEAGIRPAIWYKTETDAAPTKAPYTLSAIGDAVVGDKVVMGKYDADANEENGAEDIVWTVAAVENGKKLLVSDKVLDAFTYNIELNEAVDWSNNTLKIWVNGAFAKKAFGTEELAKIANSSISTPIAGKEDFVTYAQVFILSAEELVKYFPNREDRMVKPTATAIANGVYADPIYDTCDYWVREAGTTAGNGAYVYYYGDVNEAGALARSTYIGVRPAIWVLP